MAETPRPTPTGEGLPTMAEAILEFIKTGDEARFIARVEAGDRPPRRYGSNGPGEKHSSGVGKFIIVQPENWR